MTKQHLLFDYPFPPSDAVAFFRKYFGPTQMTFARLDEAGQKALAADLTAHWTRNNQGDPDHTVIRLSTWKSTPRWSDSAQCLQSTGWSMTAKPPPKRA